jgi:N-ethylmaleimide reductase
MSSTRHVSHLQTPIAIGALRPRNRIIMSPMTRLRSDADLAPPEIMADYYAQRASAGLIITETIAVVAYGAGYPPLPGLFTTRQIEGWRNVAARVHAAGGLIAAQLWHVGRARGEADAEGRPPGWAVADEVKPDELDAIDIAAMVKAFVSGATAARSAGFDAVEIHNGNGFLLDRFLRAATNHRHDLYGGSLENRTRLTLEIIAAVADAIGADRVGIRLSPSATVGDSADPTGQETFAYLLERLQLLGLAYVHATRTTMEDRAHGSGPGIPLQWIREHYDGKLIGAGEFNRDDGEAAVADGTLDAVAYGRPFLANPDLPERFASGAPLNTAKPETFYTPGPEGLVDYPRLSPQ